MGKIIIIAAVADNGVIGNQGSLPWHIPEDLRRFKELTSENIVLMGRKTFESLRSKPLPGRLNIVISKSLKPLLRNDVVVWSDLKIMRMVEDDRRDLYIIGGAEIYKQTIDLADKVKITRVHCSPEGDSYFPAIPREKYNLLETFYPDNKEAYHFETYVKNSFC